MPYKSAAGHETLVKMRGALITIEGICHSGKSWHCQKLATALSQYYPTECISTRDTNTPLGQNVYSRLKGSLRICNKSIFHMCAATRWETRERVITLMESGINVLIDGFSSTALAYAHVNNIPQDVTCFVEREMIQADLEIVLAPWNCQIAGAARGNSDLLDMEMRVNDILKENAAPDCLFFTNNNAEEVHLQIFNKVYPLVQTIKTYEYPIFFRE